MEIKIKKFKSIDDEITLSFDESNIISLIGENGSGKSNILDGIYHIYSNGNEEEIVTTNFDNFDKNKKNLKITYIEDCNNDEKIKINNFINKYNIKNMENIKMEKHFYKTIDTLYSSSMSINTSYLYSLLEQVMIILDKYNSKYPTLNILNEIEFVDNKDRIKIWDINKSKIKMLKTLNDEDWRFLTDFSNEIDEMKLIFNAYDLIVTYSKNAEIDNNIDYTYDFLKYETDSNTARAINFFVENPLDIIAILKSGNDGTIKNARLIDAEKQKIKKYCEQRMEDIFSTLNIYARPKIDIDGSNLKVQVETTKNYSINDNISTKNNSSGYKSILWILLTLEKVILDSKKQKNNHIFLLDEPDKNIHPLLQQQMINYIAEKIQNTLVKVIFTTHSPFLLIEKSNHLVVNRNNSGSTTISQNGESLFSIYPKILNTKLMESPIFKFAYKNNIVIYIDNKLTQDNAQEIKQYVSTRNNSIKFDIIEIDTSNNSNMEAISSLKKFDTIISNQKLETNQKYFMNNDMFDKIIKNNDKLNQ